jgi:hypothetical protein
MYLLVSLLVYATPFVVGGLLILLVVCLPALSRTAVDNLKTSSTRPEPSGHAVTGDHKPFEPGFAGTPGFHATHS